MVQQYSPGKLMPFQNNPTYLGITLDRSLFFKDHILKLKNKVSSRFALINRVACLGCECLFNELRKAWQRFGIRSCRILLPKCTPTQIGLPTEWSHAYNLRSHNIYSCRFPSLLASCPSVGRNMACLRLHLKAQSPNHLLHEDLNARRAPDRLRSRRSLRSFTENFTNHD